MNGFTLALALAVTTLCTSMLGLGCSSTKSDAPAAPAFSTAAAMAGTEDHCGGKVVTVEPAVCHVVASEDAGQEAGAGNADGGAAAARDYGPTQRGSEGDDDDCKYHVKWQSTAVTENADVTFQIIATSRKDDSPLAGAKPYAEIFLNDTHPAPNTPVATTETSPGTYTIGPVRFDAAGSWSVRFHFHDECNDSETSPHGHVAFFVKVP